MICIECGEKEAITNDLCDPCRLKKWRKDNKEKVKTYAKMRAKRDAEKIKKYMYEHRDKIHFGGNRENALIRDNHTCQSCGVTKEDGKKIIVHHIDGNGWAKEKMNNKLDNMITLCVQCHMDIHVPSQYRKKKIIEDCSQILNNTNNTHRTMKGDACESGVKASMKQGTDMSPPPESGDKSLEVSDEN